MLLERQRKILLDVLATQFTERDEFGTFLREELGKRLDEITTGNLKVARSDVLDNADRCGWMPQLIDALYRLSVPGVTAQLRQIGAVEELGIGPSGASRDWQLRYFEQVEDELGNLRPAIPPRIAPKRAALPRQQWPLAQVFVPLELLSSRGRIQGELDWDKVIKEDRVVLTGGPGSGKSTLLRHLVLSAIDHRRKQLMPTPKSAAAGAGGTTDRLSRIPVWLNLPRAVLGIQQWRETEPGARWYKNLTVELWLEPVASAAHLRTVEDARALLETGDVLLVFDGLDEIPDPQARAALAEIISRLPKAFGALGVKNPVVVACREKAWERGGAFAAFEQFRIQPMDRTTWKHYFERWCRAVWEDDAEEVLQRLGAALRCSREVGRRRRCSRSSPAKAISLTSASVYMTSS